MPTTPKDPQLSPQLVVAAYRQGIFPMADENGAISWYAPDPRAVFELDDFRVPSRLTRTIRSERFEVVVNRDFPGTMRACAERPETWISDEIVAVYTALNRAGMAHSVESYREGRLVGGLYGVALGGAFMGESMFSRERDASKVALAFLVERLRERGFVLLDTQFMTPHLARFGARHIPLADYLSRLEPALALPCRFD